jgi:hypothetical protein
MVRLDPNRKLFRARFNGPYTVTQVFDNGTVQLSKATNGGAVLQTWNIRNIVPCATDIGARRAYFMSTISL